MTITEKATLYHGLCRPDQILAFLYAIRSGCYQCYNSTLKRKRPWVRLRLSTEEWLETNSRLLTLIDLHEKDMVKSPHSFANYLFRDHYHRVAILHVLDDKNNGCLDAGLRLIAKVFFQSGDKPLPKH
ncbi:hypothetical protein [Olivibacter domesticus]|nr:hypothetical protein [Olivibacter domesticus]